MISFEHEQTRGEEKYPINQEITFSCIYSERVDFAWQSVVRSHQKLTIRSAESEGENMKTPAAEYGLLDGKKSHTVCDLTGCELDRCGKCPIWWHLRHSFLLNLCTLNPDTLTVSKGWFFRGKQLLFGWGKLSFYRWCTYRRDDNHQTTIYCSTKSCDIWQLTWHDW